MRAIVDADVCIGCGMCAETCPIVFQMEDDVATVKAEPVPDDQEASCRQAEEERPVDAISIVE